MDSVHLGWGEDVFNDTSYTRKDFYKELNRIDFIKIQDMINHECDYTYRKRVHELAKELDTTSAFLIYVSKVIGINFKTAQASITPEKQKEILKYILEESKPKG